MNSVTVHVFKARDTEGSYALACAGDRPGTWRAQNGFGSDFEKEWTVEFQSESIPNLATIDWTAVLERAIQAAELNDPVITDYRWPATAA